MTPPRSPVDALMRFGEEPMPDQYHRTIPGHRRGARRVFVIDRFRALTRLNETFEHITREYIDGGVLVMKPKGVISLHGIRSSVCNEIYYGGFATGTIAPRVRKAESIWGRVDLRTNPVFRIRFMVGMEVGPVFNSQFRDMVSVP